MVEKSNDLIVSYSILFPNSWNIVVEVALEIFFSVYRVSLGALLELMGVRVHLNPVEYLEGFEFGLAKVDGSQHINYYFAL